MRASLRSTFVINLVITHNKNGKFRGDSSNLTVFISAGILSAGIMIASHSEHPEVRWAFFYFLEREKYIADESIECDRIFSSKMDKSVQQQKIISWRAALSRIL